MRKIKATDRKAFRCTCSWLRGCRRGCTCPGGNRAAVTPAPRLAPLSPPAPHWVRFGTPSLDPCITVKSDVNLAPHFIHTRIDIRMRDRRL